MGIAQRIKSGSTEFYSARGPSLLESLWTHLLNEWTDPDDDSTNEFDAGYVTGLAYAIAKIQAPYVGAEQRIEAVLDEARERLGCHS